MATRKDPSEDTCPVARTLALVGDRWSLMIVRDAFDGMHRFSDFQRSLAVARNILSDRLRRLVDAGILATRPASDGSAYQEYVLTEMGERLFPIVLALRQWGERHLFARGERRSQMVEKRTGKPVPLMMPRSSDGEVLLPAEAEVRKPR
ncbi:winged helix-turn-helix transcriptional regulator [Cupriavidus necator]|uniref:winged helix-turn-helix transcriptional regulator n=1 Tax=Cupriavidus necator TaxID=106590 RepID=UPI002782B81B|nr:helix-turn-helix domain-containing protein [Cupriavidus necator]MDQ0138919.1 DNA-binding HxlR family transcriptional regulator [Cupriavidus necator]